MPPINHQYTSQYDDIYCKSLESHSLPLYLYTASKTSKWYILHFKFENANYFTLISCMKAHYDGMFSLWLMYKIQVNGGPFTPIIFIIWHLYTVQTPRIFQNTRVMHTDQLYIILWSHLYLMNCYEVSMKAHSLSFNLSRYKFQVPLYSTNSI